MLTRRRLDCARATRPSRCATRTRPPRRAPSQRPGAAGLDRCWRRHHARRLERRPREQDRRRESNTVGRRRRQAIWIVLGLTLLAGIVVAGATVARWAPPGLLLDHVHRVERGDLDSRAPTRHATSWVSWPASSQDGRGAEDRARHRHERGPSASRPTSWSCSRRSMRS